MEDLSEFVSILTTFPIKEYKGLNPTHMYLWAAYSMA